MNVYDTVRADELDGGENILLTRRIGRAVVHIPVIEISLNPIEHDHIFISGVNWDTGDSVIWLVHSDEDVDLWA